MKDTLQANSAGLTSSGTQQGTDQLTDPLAGKQLSDGLSRQAGPRGPAEILKTRRTPDEQKLQAFQQLLLAEAQAALARQGPTMPHLAPMGSIALQQFSQIPGIRAQRKAADQVGAVAPEQGVQMHVELDHRLLQVLGQVAGLAAAVPQSAAMASQLIADTSLDMARLHGSPV